MPQFSFSYKLLKWRCKAKMKSFRHIPWDYDSIDKDRLEDGNEPQGETS